MLDLPAGLADDIAPLPEPVQVTAGDADCDDVAWRPDGAVLAFVSARHPRADRDLVRDVYAVGADGSGLRRVTASRGDCAVPGLRAGRGAARHRRARPRAPTGWTSSPGSRCPAGSRPTAGLRPLLDPERTHRGDVTPATVRRRRRGAGRASSGAARWSCCGCRWTAAPPEVLVDGPFTVRGIAAAGGVVVATVAHDRSAGELIAVTRRRPPAAHRVRRGSWANGAAAPDARADGDRAGRRPRARLGDDATGARPAPRAAGAARAGRPTGTAGRCSTRRRCTSPPATRSCSATRPGANVLAVLDAALEDPALDGDRVGVMALGGSWRLSWPPCSPAGPTGSRRRWWSRPPPARSTPRRSPCRRWSCRRRGTGARPRSRGRYGELVRRGVPAELLLFPGEAPELARSGRPRHRLARAEHLLRWWDRWLPAPAEPGA